MKLDKPFNKFTKQAYMTVIENHKRYTNFNTLGLYRSLIENINLTLEDRVEVRDYANGFFQKTFDFLQLKDPDTYYKVTNLGVELTQGDKLNLWRIIRENQQKILKQKKIKHRNFGTYAKHNCGYDTCPYNGLMIKQGSAIAENSMCFATDHHKYSKELKAMRFAKEQRDWKDQKD